MNQLGRSYENEEEIASQPSVARNTSCTFGTPVGMKVPAPPPSPRLSPSGGEGDFRSNDAVSGGSHGEGGEAYARAAGFGERKKFDFFCRFLLTWKEQLFYIYQR